MSSNVLLGRISMAAPASDVPLGSCVSMGQVGHVLCSIMFIMCSRSLLPSMPSPAPVYGCFHAFTNVWHVSECVTVLAVPAGLYMYAFPRFVEPGLILVNIPGWTVPTYIHCVEILV